MTYTQSTPSPFIRTPRGTLVPRVVRQEWLNADPEVHAIIAAVALTTTAVRLPDDGWSDAVVDAVLAAIRDDGALVCQYRNDNGIVTARCLFPTRITVTSERHIVFTAYCTARRETRSFRVDRVLDCHMLTLPGEAAA